MPPAVFATSAGTLGHGERAGDEGRVGNTMLRKSLSSEAAASLITPLTCAASDTGNFEADANHTEATGLRPRSRARVRMISADSYRAPIAALATVLAINIAACSIACWGMSDAVVRVRNSASSRAAVILQLLIQQVAAHSSEGQKFRGVTSLAVAGTEHWYCLPRKKLRHI